MNRRMQGFVIASLIWLLGVALPVWPYTEISVEHGGRITGQVILKGHEPPAKAFNLVTFPDPVYCGRISTGTGWRLVDEFQVDPDGGLKNVVVFLEGVDAGKPFTPESLTIQAQDCVFIPQVLVVRDQQPIRVVNMDPIIHEVQLYETAPFGSEVMVHRPLRLNPYHPKNHVEDHEHRAGEPLIDTIRFSKGRRIFYLECGFHPFMQAWGIAVNNPYYAITDEHGRFTITDIPEGVYTLYAWHPGLRGVLDMRVVVLADDTLKTRIEFEAPTKEQSRHTTLVEKHHFGLGALGEPLEIRPTHEVQTPQ